MKKTIILLVALIIALPLSAQKKEEFEIDKKIVKSHTRIRYERIDGSVYEGKPSQKWWTEIVPPPPGQTNDFREVYCKEKPKQVIYYTLNGKSYSSYDFNEWKKEYKKKPFKINESAPSYNFDVTILPNPAKEFVKAQFFLQEDANVSASVVTLQGMEAAKVQAVTYKTGINEINIDLTGLPSGTYYLRVQAGHHAVTKALTVIK